MILKTSQNQKKVSDSLLLVCGKSFSLIEKINNNLFGSPKYLMKAITPTRFNLDFDDYTDLVYCTVELRKKGVAIYFRFKNEEYVILTRYNQLTYVSSETSFDFQAGNFLLKLTVVDTKNHFKFIRRLVQCKNNLTN